MRSDPPSLTDILRGRPSERPPKDNTTAAGLRALIQDDVFHVNGPKRPAAPFIMTAAGLRGDLTITDVASAHFSRLRGLMVGLLVTLLINGYTVSDPFSDARDAWSATTPRGELWEYARGLDSDQRARLASDVRAHWSVLSAHLNALPSTWGARSTVRSLVSLAGGAVELHDVVDVAVGSPLASEAQVALLDVTTAPLGAHSERTARYHALVETLRTSVVPRCTTIFSTATGEIQSYDVDVELLHQSWGDVHDALHRQRVAA